MSELYLGIMSGTSLDGVDVALMDFSSRPRLIHAKGYSMPDNLRQQLLAMHQGLVHLQQLGEVHQQLGECYAQCVQDFLKENQLSAKDITAIGCHGQTIWHSPTSKYPFTLQIGNAQLLASRSQITTIADFRTKDMVYGGQGAPLVPAFHQTLFYDENYFTALLNLGGISNLTLLGERVLGFDTGPANALLDLWAEKHLNFPFDQGGEWAKKGKILPNLGAEFFSDPYFAKPPPKSTGREYFNLDWLEEKLIATDSQNAKPEDIQRTLVEMTVQCCANDLRRYVKTEKPKRLFLCGGGARNDFLVSCFKEALPDWQISLSDELGIGVDDMEACAFAWLAFQRFHNKPSNLPSVTGAIQPLSLGVIYEP